MTNLNKFAIIKVKKKSSSFKLKEKEKVIKLENKTPIDIGLEAERERKRKKRTKEEKEGINFLKAFMKGKQRVEIILYQLPANTSGKRIQMIRCGRRKILVKTPFMLCHRPLRRLIREELDFIIQALQKETDIEIV